MYTHTRMKTEALLKCFRNLLADTFLLIMSSNIRDFAHIFRCNTPLFMVIPPFMG